MDVEKQELDSKTLPEFMTTFKDKSDQDWMKIFLSYPEILDDSPIGPHKVTGSTIIEKIITPNAQYEVAVQFLQVLLQKLDEMKNDKAKDEWKERGLEIAGKNEFKAKRVDLMEVIYPGREITEKLPFLTSSFDEELSKFRNSIGVMGRETNKMNLEKFDSKLFKLLIQNPLGTLQTLLPHALRSKAFRLLNEAKSIFTFLWGHGHGQQTVLEVTLFKLLKNVEQLDHNLQHITAPKWENNTHLFVKEGFLSVQSVLIVLEQIIWKSINASEYCRLEKLVRFYIKFIGDVADDLVEDKMIGDVCRFLQKLIALTRGWVAPPYPHPKRPTWTKIMLSIRDLCLEGLSKLPMDKEVVKAGSEIDWAETEDELCMAYIRFPMDLELRELIEGQLKEKIGEWGRNDVIRHMLDILANCSPAELSGAYNLLHKILLPHLSSNDENVDDYGLDIMNCLLLNGISSKSQILPLNLLKFYSIHLHHLQEISDFHESTQAHITIIETLAYFISKCKMELVLEGRSLSILTFFTETNFPGIQILSEILDFILWIESIHGNDMVELKKLYRAGFLYLHRILVRVGDLITNRKQSNSYTAYLQTILSKFKSIIQNEEGEEEKSDPWSPVELESVPGAGATTNGNGQEESDDAEEAG